MKILDDYVENCEKGMSSFSKNEQRLVTAMATIICASHFFVFGQWVFDIIYRPELTYTKKHIFIILNTFILILALVYSCVLWKMYKKTKTSKYGKVEVLQ